MIFLRINCPNFIGLVWRGHTKFQIGMAVCGCPICRVLLPAPLPVENMYVTYSHTVSKSLRIIVSFILTGYLLPRKGEWI